LALLIEVPSEFEEHLLQVFSMRIGLFLESSPDEQGGGFKQSMSTVDALTKKNATAHHFLTFTSSVKTQQILSDRGIKTVLFKEGIFRLIDRLSSTVVGNAILRRLQTLGFRRVGRHLDALLDDHQIELVIFNEITDSVLRIGDHPYIATIWDLSHRDLPEFPEAYVSRAFQRRERQLTDTLTRALAVITNSAFCARQIVKLYRVDPARILQLPFIPPLNIREFVAGKTLLTADVSKYNLPDNYIFYPAYFTPLKNHLYILEALVELERRHGILLGAVFCGGGPALQKSTVERQTEALGLTGRVRILGLLPDNDIPALYIGALALVMPTYSGPTNLPPLEAIMLGCPVIYSDLPAFREQMDDAALYCDLANASSLSDQLAALIRDSGLRDRLKEAGKNLAAKVASIDYEERLRPVLDQYAYVRRRWTWPEYPRSVP
jgi:glycosyltransferase involved in cell wall biosynthesis